MVNSILVKSDDWYQISLPGKVISAWMDERGLGAKRLAEVRLIGAKEKPAASDFVNAKQLFRPSGNDNSMQLTPETEDTIFWAKCDTDSEATVCVSYDGIGTVKRQDVFVQDQHSNVVEAFFAEELGSTTVVSGGVVNTRTVTVSPGHGFVGFSTFPGEAFVVKGLYMGRVLSVNVNELTLDMPINQSIPAGAIAYRASTNMLVDGSSSPHTFRLVSSAGVKFDIKGIRVVFRSTTVMDYTKFGGANALTAPFVIRKKISDARYDNIVAARTNGELELVLSLKNSDRAPSGEYGMLAEYAAADSRGVVLRVDGSKNEEIQAVVYADLRVGNTFLRASAYGHVMEG